MRVQLTIFLFADFSKMLDEAIVVEEGKSAKIRLRPTIPVGCALGEAWRDQCVVDVLVHVPKYDEGQCDAGINGNTITFSNQRCGVRITSSAWDSEVSAEITAFPDGHIDSDPVNLYIYLKTTTEMEHDIWSDVILPNVKVLVLDEDGVKTSKKYCQSYNDPHMTTFDGRTWENQWYADEYVLYRSDVYPISVNAKYQWCWGNRSPTCNCGIAVRSYMSLFVANFCKNNNYQHGVGHINSYIEKRGCDDQHMVVQTNGNKYVITLPNGAVVKFEFANVGLQRVTVQASVLDWESSSGLCGYLNNNQADDFKLRNSQAHTQDTKTFSDSWRVNATDSLFKTDVVLDVAGEDLRSYCVCDKDAVKNEIFDKLTCSETKGIQLCGSDTTENTGIYYTDCSGNKGKRDVYGSDSIVGPIEASLFRSLEIPESTKEWTDEKATAYCEKYIGQSALASLCNETVGIEVESYVEACILDIKYTNDTAYASVTLDTFKEICVTEAGRNITFSKSASPVNGTNTTMLEYMLERSCKNDCSDHGVCIQGLCNCTGGYIDVDCTQHRETPPIIFGIPNYGRCDAVSRPCEMISVVGSNIAPSDIHCRVREYKLQKNSTEKHDVPGVHMTQGIRQSYGVAFCKFPEKSRKKREADKDTVATGYYVSLGYDGLHFSDEYTVIVYDGSCFNCSEDHVCVMKDDCPYIEHSTSTPAADSTKTTEVVLTTQEITTVVSSTTTTMQPTSTEISSTTSERQTTESQTTSSSPTTTTQPTSTERPSTTTERQTTESLTTSSSTTTTAQPPSTESPSTTTERQTTEAQTTSSSTTTTTQTPSTESPSTTTERQTTEAQTTSSSQTTTTQPSSTKAPTSTIKASNTSSGTATSMPTTSGKTGSTAERTTDLPNRSDSSATLSQLQTTEGAVSQPFKSDADVFVPLFAGTAGALVFAIGIIVGIVVLLKRHRRLNNRTPQNHAPSTMESYPKRLSVHSFGSRSYHSDVAGFPQDYTKPRR